MKRYVLLKFVLLSVCSIVTHNLFADSSTIKRYRDQITESVDVKSGIVYAEHLNVQGEKEKLALDIYSPENDSEKKRCAILLFHGGSFRNGSRETYYKMAAELAKRGYVVIPVDYRLRDNPQEDYNGTIRDAVEDGAAAVQWTAIHATEYGIDSQKIFVGGDSAGGYLALALAYTKNYDTTKYKLPHIPGVIDMYGGNINIPEGKILPPAIIIHGDKDPLVPYESSVSLCERLKKAGIYYDFFTMTGEGHAYRNKYFNEIITRIASFALTVMDKNR